MAHGPGGLLATPGMGRKWGKRKPSVATKAMTRSEAARVAALARWGKYRAPPKLSKPMPTTRPAKPTARRSGGKRSSGGKGKDPAQIAHQQQRDQEHVQDRAQRQQDRADRLARQATRDQERQQVQQRRAGEQLARQMDRTLRDQEKKRQAEERAKKGGGGGGGSKGNDKKQEQATREARARAERAGQQAERRADARRRAAESERQGHQRRTDQTQRRQEQQTERQRRERLQAQREAQRQQERTQAQIARDTARQQREQEAADRRRVTTPEIADAARRLSAGEPIDAQEQETLIRNGLARRGKDGVLVLTGTGLRASRQKEASSFAVFKDASGKLRWIARSTTAYRDRDGEIISVKALEDDAARMTASGQYGPLRYWHIGEPDPFDPVTPWGPGLDIGTCDYSTVIGRTAIESGTFKSEAIGQAFAESASDYELSPGFFHPMDEPDVGGVYHAIRRFERSAVPTRYGRASNLFTGMAVKEHRMDQQTYEARVKAYLTDMNEKGVPPEIAAGQLASMQQADKSAEQRGITFKSLPGGQVYWDGDGNPGRIIDGRWVTFKAAPPELEPEAKADPPVELEMEAEPMEPEGGQFIGDMTPAEFWAQLQQYLAPVLKVQELHKSLGDMMGEMKGMMGGYATKDDSRAAEIASLKAQQATLEQRLKALEGDQPAVTLPSEIEAALKSSGPQAPPDPAQPVIPDDPGRPWAPMAAALFPDLYRNGQ